MMTLMLMMTLTNDDIDTDDDDDLDVDDINNEDDIGDRIMMIWTMTMMRLLMMKSC